MLKRLRLKFIALNMSCVAIVLLLLCIVICSVDYQSSLEQVERSLSITLNHAEEPRMKDHGPKDDEELPPLPDEPDESQNTAQTGPVPLEIGGEKGDVVIPVAAFILQPDGSLQEVPSKTTATIASDVLAQAAQETLAVPPGFGQLPNLSLVYEKRVINDITYVAFTDLSYVNTWHSLALYLAGASVLALVILLVINIFFARWALKPVASAWQQQRQFVADASHDLKTPLTVILANTSILLEHPEKPIASQTQWIDSTQHEAQHMQALVNDLLLLAKLDEEQTTTSTIALAETASEMLDFSDLVEGELLQFESIAFERDINLTSTVEPELTVSGNLVRLRRVVATLIDNACKYTQAGQLISVSLTKSGRNAKLVVHNTGTVIAPEDLPHIFDRFYRADKARTRDVGGHGLGLAIAHSIAQEHKGTLAAKSNEREGTTFTLTLPLAL